MLLLSSQHGVIGCIRVYSTFQPDIQRAEPKTPAFTDLESWHLFVPGFAFQRFPMHTKDRSGLV